MPALPVSDRCGRAAALIATLCALGVLAGFANERHLALDTIGHFCAHLSFLAVLGGAVALLRRSWRGRAIGIAALAVGLAGLASVAPYWSFAGAGMPQRPGTPDADADRGGEQVSLLQMNLRFDADTAPAIALIRRLKPDVVTMQEASSRWHESLNGLTDLYPDRRYCGTTTVIFSRLPFVGSPRCLADRDFLAQAVELDDGRHLTVVSEHLGWPWPFAQPVWLKDLRPVFAALDAPFLIAGDFNAAPWSAAVGSLAAAGAEVVRGVGPTWIDRRLPPEIGRYVGLPIDQILVSSGARVETLSRPEATGSDHLPVFAIVSY